MRAKRSLLFQQRRLLFPRAGQTLVPFSLRQLPCCRQEPYQPLYGAPADEVTLPTVGEVVL